MAGHDGTRNPVGFDEGLIGTDITGQPASGEPTFTAITTGSRGDLSGWICLPADRLIRVSVTVVHGLGEHADRYRELGNRLARLGIATLAFDQQGHGSSPGRRGAPRSYDSMLEDISHAVARLASYNESAPAILLGHSMGGNLAVNFALRCQHQLAGMILSAPMLLPKNPPKRDQIFAAWLTGKIFPFIRLHSPVDPQKLTHDLREIEIAKRDHRMHSKISLRLGTQLLAQGRHALDNARQLSLPILVLHGEQDDTTDTEASQALALKAGDTCTYINFEGMYHDLLHEQEREKVFAVLESWLIRQFVRDL